jgi:hypothetical protein
LEDARGAELQCSIDMNSLGHEMHLLVLITFLTLPKMSRVLAQTLLLDSQSLSAHISFKKEGITCKFQKS